MSREGTSTLIHHENCLFIKKQVIIVDIMTSISTAIQKFLIILLNGPPRNDRSIKIVKSFFIIMQ
ncbi:hypothetical protein LSO9J_40051 [Candidatus Liberibacter solanacearum]